MEKAKGNNAAFGKNRRLTRGGSILHSGTMSREARLLLDWYEIHGRDLPWRVRGGPHPDPYAVWVSEIMLQQTTVQTVEKYFTRWMKRFPDLAALAAAPLDEVLQLWQGLGYYTRAKKMHLCARTLTDSFQGRFPADRETLLKLPGIGPYTASSICAFAFDKPETVVDGNVIRVLSRYYGITDEVSREKVTPLAEKLTPDHACADYASAIMDLGAVICKPVSPSCLLCPWHAGCAARAKGLQEQIPRLKKTVKKHKEGALFVLTDPAGALFVRRRPGKGLLSGLWELPWSEDGTPPFSGNWTPMPLQIRHVFTHFSLTLHFFEAASPAPENFLSGGLFLTDEQFPRYAFSTLMKKALKKLGRMPLL